MKRQGLDAVSGADIDNDFLGRVEVNGLTGVTVVEGCCCDVGAAAFVTGCFGPGEEAMGKLALVVCFGVDGTTNEVGRGEVGEVC